MENEKVYQVAVDRAKTMAKLAVLSGVLGLVLGILALVFGLIVKDYVASNTFSLGLVAYAVVVVFSVAAFIYALLSEAANQEEIDKLSLEKRKAAHHAFEVDEDVRFTAGRSFANYKRFAPMVITLITVFVLFILLSMFAGYWGNANLKLITNEASNSLRALIVAILFLCVSGFAGAFYIGQARAASFRWLRAVGAWFIMAFLIMLAAAVELCLRHFRFEDIAHLEKPLGWAVFGVLAVLAGELVVNFIVDFYRPRTVEEPRPMFESNLLSLFTEPGGVMRNIAETLDYQFGFKVSGTYIYGFIERALFPALIIWVVVLWAFTSIDQVGSGERGLRMRAGRLASETPLTPGVYFKLPWPFERIDRYSISQIREVVVGHVHDHPEFEDDPEDEAHLGHSHGATAEEKEADFMAREAATKHISRWEDHEGDIGGAPSFMLAVRGDNVTDHTGLPTHISFVNATFPIQYQIRESELLNYAHRNAGAANTLRLLGESITTELLASRDISEVLATHRGEITAAVWSELQRRADELKLGVEIVGVNMLDAHPAPATVSAFQQVLGAREDMRISELRARVESLALAPLAAERANQMVTAAKITSATKIQEAAAGTGRFARQVQSYEAIPGLFKLKMYLAMLIYEGASVRKYIVPAGMDSGIFDINLEENMNLPFTDVQLGN